MSIINIPSPLQSYVEGQKSVDIDGSSIEEVILNLVEKYPGLKQQIFDPQGNMRAFLAIFFGGVKINDLKDGFHTLVKEEDQLDIIASMAGG